MSYPPRNVRGCHVALSTDWLLDSDPAIRWQVIRDLTGEPVDVVTAERARVAVEGWGAELLVLQGTDGRWDGGTYRPGWVDALYFEGETEPCINGIALVNGAYFGEAVDGIVDRLVSEQLDDGGWNCFAEYGATVSSFHTTICVLEGLLEWEHAGGSSEVVAAARSKGEEYLLERGLFRARSTGQIIDPRFTMFSFPTRWYYDVLRGLDYLRLTGAALDDRSVEAIDLVAAKRDGTGRWPLENTHQGPTHFEMEGPEGFPSRWNTLRAIRVLDLAGSG